MRNIDSVHLKKNFAYDQTLYWFFSYPTRAITLTELAKEIKISKKTANQVVSKLIKENFLCKEEIGRSWRITCNQNHLYNYTRKIIYNLELVYVLLYNHGLLEAIHGSFGVPKSIILFGSYRKGDDNEKSDIDIAVEVAGNAKLRIKTEEIPEFGFRKKVPVTLHVFSRNNIDPNLFANIANGIVLEGFLEVKP
jgi:predicted nucleotidyltransferase